MFAGCFICSKYFPDETLLELPAEYHVEIQFDRMKNFFFLENRFICHYCFPKYYNSLLKKQFTKFGEFIFLKDSEEMKIFMKNYPDIWLKISMYFFCQNIKYLINYEYK